MKARLAQMEAEASKLREGQVPLHCHCQVQVLAGHCCACSAQNELLAVQAKAGDDGAAAQGDAADAASREEVDSRSVYVGQVDYACTPEELQMHFNSCGTVNRVTILTDKFGQAKARCQTLLSVRGRGHCSIALRMKWWWQAAIVPKEC